MKRVFLFFLFTFFVFFTVKAVAEDIEVPHKFRAGEVAKASEVNANFQTLKEAIEQLERLLQKSIAELEAKSSTIESLEKENQVLKESITELKTRIEALEKSISKLPTTSQRTSLRSKPLTASEEEFKEVFKLDENRRPREYIQNDYENLGDVIIDHATGSMWQKSGSDEGLTYQQAQAYIEKLNRERFAGYDDWRLPTIEELMSLLESGESSNGLYINSIFGATQRWCWSADKRSSGAAWHVDFYNGFVSWGLVEGSGYVRCVRSW